MVECLHLSEDSQVSWPTHEERNRLAELVKKKYPDLERYGVWGAIDGCKVRITIIWKEYKSQVVQ